MTTKTTIDQGQHTRNINIMTKSIRQHYTKLSSALWKESAQIGMVVKYSVPGSPAGIARAGQRQVDAADALAPSSVPRRRPGSSRGTIMVKRRAPLQSKLVDSRPSAYGENVGSAPPKQAPAATTCRETRMAAPNGLRRQMLHPNSAP